MNEKNLIFEALAFLDNCKPSPSMMQMSNTSSVYDIYLKNAVISLVSIKRQNPKTDVAIVTNVDINEEYKKILDEHGIIMWKCPFEAFRMPLTLTYSLSYYKLCAFDFVAETTNYNHICFIDCDTFGVNNFNELWKEAESAFLIIPNDSTCDAKVRNEIIELYARMKDKTQKRIPHMCSGFIIGARLEISRVLKLCHSVYDEIVAMENILPQGGDEVIWSLALADYNGRIYSPKVYGLLSNVGAKKYWVDKADFEDPAIVMWHLPAEKRYALIWAYKKLRKSGNVPTIKQMAKACRIRHIGSRFTVLSVVTILQDRTVIKRNVTKCMRKFGGE